MTFTIENENEWSILYSSAPDAVKAEMRRFIDDLHDSLTGKMNSQRVYFIQKGWGMIFDRFKELSGKADDAKLLKLQEKLDKDKVTPNAI